MTLSIIIPTLNEEDTLPALLTELKRSPLQPQILIADAGSEDNTTDIALDAGCRLINCEVKGRGAQMNAALPYANGDVVLMLHADSQLPKHGLEVLMSQMENQPNLVGGNFRLRFDGQDWFSRGMSWVYNQLRPLNLYYGDSGIFARKKWLEVLGGIPELPIMEDVALVRQLERLGPTTRIETPEIVTSSRRFEGKPPLKTLYVWGKMHWLYETGASPETLQQTYERFKPLPSNKQASPEE